MFQAFFVKSSALKLFTWIYLVPFIFGCVAIRINFDDGIFFWIIPTAVGLIAWFITVGLHLHTRTEHALRLNKTLFIVSSILSLIIAIQLIFDGVHTISLGAYRSFVAFAMIVFAIYSTYFFSKSLTMVELRRSTSVLTYLGTMILLGMMPLGIFLIQPRIQKIAQPQ